VRQHSQISVTKSASPREWSRRTGALAERMPRSAGRGRSRAERLMGPRVILGGLTRLERCSGCGTSTGNIAGQGRRPRGRRPVRPAQCPVPHGWDNRDTLTTLLMTGIAASSLRCTAPNTPPAVRRRTARPVSRRHRTAGRHRREEPASRHPAYDQRPSLTANEMTPTTGRHL
jgi:hypothetical protein